MIITARLRLRACTRPVAGVVFAAAAAVSAVAFATGLAGAQTAALEPARPATERPPATDQPGIIGSIGNWVQQGVANMGAGFGAMVDVIGGQANQAAKGAADAARDTAAGVAKLSATGFIRGRELCLLAPNGAPDCRVAAETMCRARGYTSGTSIDFVTSEKCPPRRRAASRDPVAGHDPAEDVCTLEHFVTRAMCQ
jgi:hypothetical protein